jgi:hypothetical protein
MAFSMSTSLSLSSKLRPSLAVKTRNQRGGTAHRISTVRVVSYSIWQLKVDKNWCDEHKKECQLLLDTIDLTVGPAYPLPQAHFSFRWLMKELLTRVSEMSQGEIGTKHICTVGSKSDHSIDSDLVFDALGGGIRSRRRFEPHMYQ